MKQPKNSAKPSRKRLSLAKKDRTEEARKRLGITAEDMKGVPKIGYLFRAAEGGMDACLEALRGYDDEDAQAFVEKYDSVSKSDMERLTVEEVCIASGLTIRRLREILLSALAEQSAEVSKVMVLTSQKSVIDATIKAATRETPIFDREGSIVGHTNGDVKAMEIFHKATGFLPTPKGATTTINLQQLNQTANNPALGEGDEEKCLPPPSTDEFLLDMQDVVRPKQLPAPETLPVNAPEIDYLDVQ
jgi:hypothetical protein